MKVLLLILAVLLMASLSCRQESDSRAGQKGPPIPKEAYKPLTEDDIVLFLKVWPILDRLADSAKYENPKVTYLDNTVSQWAKMIDSLRTIAGLEQALVEMGTDWSSFRAIAYRIQVTIYSIGYKGAAAETRSHMRYSRPGEKSVLRKRLSEQRQIVKQVPKTNEEVFKPHERELLDIFYQLLE